MKLPICNCISTGPWCKNCDEYGKCEVCEKLRTMALEGRRAYLKSLKEWIKERKNN